MEDLCLGCVNVCSSCGHGTSIVFTCLHIIFEERPAVIVNATKDISISTLCFWESSLCIRALCLVFP